MAEIPEETLLARLPEAKQEEMFHNGNLKTKVL